MDCAGALSSQKAFFLIRRHRCRKISTENACLDSTATQLGERIDDFAVSARTAHIQIETVFPRTAFHGPAFDLEQIKATPRKRLERAVQRARLMRKLDDYRKLVRVFRKILFRR